MALKLPARVFIPPPIYCKPEQIPVGEPTTISQLCERADVVYRATVSKERAITVYFGDDNFRARDVDAVGVPVEDLQSPEAALRALEVLAYSFHDHIARHCLCGRGYFSAPEPPPCC